MTQKPHCKKCRVENKLFQVLRAGHKPVFYCYYHLLNWIDYTMKKDKPKELKPFDPTEVYRRVVGYYMDKKGWPLEQANAKAQEIVMYEKRKRGLP